MKPSEWDDVEKFIFDNRQWFAGISLLPASGDKDYPQAPFCTVYSPKEIVSRYGDGALMASGLIVAGLKAFSDNLWEACDAAQGLGTPQCLLVSAVVQRMPLAEALLPRV